MDLGRCLQPDPVRFCKQVCLMLGVRPIFLTSDAVCTLARKENPPTIVRGNKESTKQHYQQTAALGALLKSAPPNNNNNCGQPFVRGFTGGTRGSLLSFPPFFIIRVCCKNHNGILKSDAEIHGVSIRAQTEQIKPLSCFRFFSANNKSRTTQVFIFSKTTAPQAPRPTPKSCASS